MSRVNDVLASLQVDPSGPGQPQPVDGVSEPPTFERAASWQTVTTSVAPGFDAAPLTWAANIPIRASDLASEAVIDRLPFQPGETMKALPPDGVVAIASVGSPGTGPNPNFPPVPAWIHLDRARDLFRAAGLDFETLKKSALSREFKPVSLGVTATFQVQNTLREIASNPGSRSR